MNKDRFIELVKKPELIDSSDIRTLIPLTKVYPYCSNLFVMIAKGYYDLNHPNRKKILDIASIRVANLKTFKSILKKKIEVIQENIIEEEDVLEELKKQEEMLSQQELEALRGDIWKNLDDLRYHKRKVLQIIEDEEREEKNAEEVKNEVTHSPPTVTKKPVKKTTTATRTRTTRKSSPKKADLEKIVEEQRKIINEFIEKTPNFTSNELVTDNFTQPDLSQSSTHLSNDLISERLAVMLIDQGKFDKAIEMYQKLILKFPQKKAYFAGLIENLTNNYLT